MEGNHCTPCDESETLYLEEDIPPCFQGALSRVNTPTKPLNEFEVQRVSRVIKEQVVNEKSFSDKLEAFIAEMKAMRYVSSIQPSIMEQVNDTSQASKSETLVEVHEHQLAERGRRQSKKDLPGDEFVLKQLEDIYPPPPFPQRLRQQGLNEPVYGLVRVKDQRAKSCSLSKEKNCSIKPSIKATTPSNSLKEIVIVEEDRDGHSNTGPEEASLQFQSHEEKEGEKKNDETSLPPLSLPKLQPHGHSEQLQQVELTFPDEVGHDCLSPKNESSKKLGLNTIVLYEPLEQHFILEEVDRWQRNIATTRSIERRYHMVLLQKLIGVTKIQNLTSSMFNTQFSLHGVELSADQIKISKKRRRLYKGEGLEMDAAALFIKEPE